MSMGAVFALTLLSLLGLGYFVRTDPKRRRAFKQAKLDRRPLLWPARVALFGPGILLIATAHWSGLAIWAGTVTVVGWLMAAISPETYARRSGELHSATKGAFSRFGRRVGHPLIILSIAVSSRALMKLKTLRTRRADPANADPSLEEVNELKARIVALEARLHRLENGPAPQETKTQNANNKN